MVITEILEERKKEVEKLGKNLDTTITKYHKDIDKPQGTVIKNIVEESAKIIQDYYGDAADNHKTADYINQIIAGIPQVVAKVAQAPGKTPLTRHTLNDVCDAIIKYSIGNIDIFSDIRGDELKTLGKELNSMAGNYGIKEKLNTDTLDRKLARNVYSSLKSVEEMLKTTEDTIKNNN